MGTEARDINSILGDIKFYTETLNKVSDGMQECIDENLSVDQFTLVCLIGCEVEKRSSTLIQEFSEAVKNLDITETSSGMIAMYRYFLTQHIKAHENVCNKLQELFPIM